MSSDEQYLKKELYELIQKDPSIFEFFQMGSLDGIWYWDLENPEHEWMSSRFWTSLGYDPEEKKHHPSEWQALIHPDDLQVALENFKNHCDDPNFPYDQIVRYRHQNGNTVWSRCRGIVIRDEKGKPVRMLGAHNDLTKQKQAEEALIKERDLVQKYPDTVETIIVALTREGRISLINPKGCQLIGYRNDELVGRKWFYRCLPQPEGMEEVYPFFLKLISGDIGAVEYFENPIVCKNGQLRHIAWHNALMRDEKGHITGTLSAGEDITEKKFIEKRLLESETKYRRLVEATPYGIEEVDLEGQIIFSNTAHHRMLGYQPGELLGSFIWDHDPTPESAQRVKDYFGHLIKKRPEPEPFYSKNVTKNGTVIDV